MRTRRLEALGFCVAFAALIGMASAGPPFAAPASEIGVGSRAPAIDSEVWLNTRPLRAADLKGKVVLVEFWTFGCWNCRNVEPHVKQWHAAYSDRGLVVIAVHSPEFKHEADVESLRRYVAQSGIRYPVAVDNEFLNWNRYGNQYWPAVYLVDRSGVIRWVKVGEGDYDLTESRLQELLAEPTPHLPAE